MVTVVTIILAVGSVSKIPSQSSQPSHTPKRILRPRRSIRRLGPVSLGENIFQAVDGSGAVREYGNAGVHAGGDDAMMWYIVGNGQGSRRSRIPLGEPTILCSRRMKVS